MYLHGKCLYCHLVYADQGGTMLAASKLYLLFVMPSLLGLCPKCPTKVGNCTF